MSTIANYPNIATNTPAIPANGAMTDEQFSAMLAAMAALTAALTSMVAQINAAFNDAASSNSTSSISGAPGNVVPLEPVDGSGNAAGGKKKQVSALNLARLESLRIIESEKAIAAKKDGVSFTPAPSISA